MRRDTDTNGNRAVMTVRAVLTVLAALLIVGLALESATAQKRSYTLDTDPARLGRKSLEAGRLEEARSHFEEAVANNHKIDEAYHGLAVIAVREGRYEDAEANYRRALAAGGDQHPEAQAGLGLLLLRLGRDLEARQEFERALDADDKVWDAHYGLARLDIEARAWAAADKKLARGRDRKGVAEGEDQYHHGRALVLLGQGDVEEAEKSALRAMTMNPTDPDYGALVARIYEMQGDVSLAIQAYEQALATPGMEPTAPLLRALGNLYLEENRFNEARDRFQQAVAVDSTYAPALGDLADLFRRAERPELAARTYLRFVEIEPEHEEAWLHLSEALYELGRTTQAVQAADAALKLAPESAEARFAYARAGIHSRDESVQERAAATMAELMATDPDLPWRAADLVALASLQTKRQQFGAARRSLEQAAALDPDLFQIPFQQGIVALRMGQAEAAMAYFQRAAELSPESAAVHMNLGIAAYQAGRLDQAIPAFRAAVELDPDRTVARLLLAQALAATEQVEAAEKEYRHVLAREPDNAKAQRGIGFCRLRQADYQSALEAYRAAATAEPGSADSWAGMGSAYLGMEKLEEARDAFAKARAIDPNNVMMLRGSELLDQALGAGKENDPR